MKVELLEIISRIPYGKVTSYGKVAEQLDIQYNIKTLEKYYAHKQETNFSNIFFQNFHQLQLQDIGYLIPPTHLIYIYISTKECNFDKDIKTPNYVGNPYYIRKTKILR